MKVHDQEVNQPCAIEGDLIVFPEDNQYTRSSDVIYHEYGYIIIFRVFGQYLWQWGAGDEAGAMMEGFPDYFSAMVNNDHEIGEDVPPSRNLDNTLIYPDSMTGEWHHDGQIIGGALWNLRVNLSNSRLADSLFFEGFKKFHELVRDHHPSYRTFSKYHLGVLLADDPDDIRENGSPHDNAIFRAFVEKGIKLQGSDLQYIPRPFDLSIQVEGERIQLIWKTYPLRY